MKDYLKKIIRNTFGFSALETVISIAVFGGIALIVAQNLKSQQDVLNLNRKSLNIETTLKQLGTAFKKKSVCDKIFDGATQSTLASNTKMFKGEEGNLPPMPIDARIVGIEIGEELSGQMKLGDINIEMTGTSGKVPIIVKLDFIKKNPANADESIVVTREVTADIYINDDGSVECNNYDASEIEIESLTSMCEMAGGTMNGSICDIPNIQSDLNAMIQRKLCEMIGGNFNGSTCSSIAVTGTFNSANLNPSRVCVNGNSQCRTKFDHSNCGGNQYLVAINVPGTSKSCGGVSFGASSTGTGVGPGGPPGATCTQPSTYNLNSGSCVKTDYDASDRTCATTSTSSTPAPACKVFREGTCAGEINGVLESLPDGDPCNGGNDICISGSCSSLDGDGDCAEDSFSISGNNCVKSSFTLASDNSCTPSTTTTQTLGSCESFQSGTCTGSTDGLIIADTTGPGCTSTGRSATCPGGAAPYPSRSACESSGRYDCSISFFLKRDPTLTLCAGPGGGCTEHFCRGEAINPCEGNSCSWQRTSTEDDDCRTATPCNSSFAQNKIRGGCDSMDELYLCMNNKGCSCRNAMVCFKTLYQCRK